MLIKSFRTSMAVLMMFMRMWGKAYQMLIELTRQAMRLLMQLAHQQTGCWRTPWEA